MYLMYIIVEFINFHNFTRFAKKKLSVQYKKIKVLDLEYNIYCVLNENIFEMM